MALQVWLPLDGDMRQLGLQSNLTMTNSHLVTFTNGDNGIAANFPSTVTISNINSLYRDKISIACWIKCVTQSSWIPIISFSFPSRTWNLYNAPSARLKFEYVPARNYYWNSSMEGKYIHLIMTSGGHQEDTKLYINGQLLIAGTDDSYPSHELCSSIALMAQTKTQLRDFRVYDHILSDQEAEQLARGLMVHYPFDNYNIEPVTNLITSITNGGRTHIENGTTVVTDGVNADTYFQLNLSETIQNNVTYTLSCDCPDMNEYWDFPIGSQNSGMTWRIVKGHNVRTFTFTNWSYGNNRIFLDDLSGPDRGRIIHLTNWVLTKTDHEIGYIPFGGSTQSSIIYDISGFNNNAIINNTGTKQICSDGITPRYKQYTYLNNANITHNNRMANGLTQQWTCMAWIKPKVLQSASMNSWCSRNWIFYSNTNQQLLYLNSGTNDYYCYGRTSLPLNQWTHLAFVFNNYTGRREIYHNGALVSSADGPNKTSTPGSIQDVISIFSGFDGYVVDYREYCTDLSTAQIKKIYDISMNIDSAGHSSARILS